MSLTICIINQKGGVGKTTTAVNLLCGLEKRGFKCLGIDLDYQCCMSDTLQAKPGYNIADVLTGKCSIQDAIQKAPETSIVPGSSEVVFTESKLKGESVLKKSLESISKFYDYIVIDTTPHLGMLSINALIASDYLVVPLLPDIYSLKGLLLLHKTISPVLTKNKNLKIAGLLFCMYDARTSITREVKNLSSKICESMNTKVFSTIIRRGVSIRESQARNQSVMSYAPQSKPAEDYQNFITELLESIEK